MLTDTVIKFAGKAVGTNEWHYGGYYKNKGDIVYIVESMNSFVRVVPETLSRFTGFTDIAGKEIFEHSIIQSAKYPEIKGRVGWYGDGWAFIGRAYDDDFDVSLERYLGLYQMKVIGNIFDKPELLEACYE